MCYVSSCVFVSQYVIVCWGMVVFWGGGGRRLKTLFFATNSTLHNPQQNAQIGSIFSAHGAKNSSALDPRNLLLLLSVPKATTSRVIIQIVSPFICYCILQHSIG